MKYIFIKNTVTLSGYFEEPIYDGAPEIGNYQRDIIRTIRNDVAVYDEEKHAIVLENEYGVSLYGSTAYLFLELKEYIKTGDVIEVDQEFYYSYKEIQEALRENREMEFWIYECIDLSEHMTSQDEDEISEGLLQTALEEIHLKSRMAQLMVSIA